MYKAASDLLLAAPVLAVGEAIVLTLGLFFGLDDAVFLKLNQAAVRVPCLSAERTQTQKMCHLFLSMITKSFYFF